MVSQTAARALGQSPRVDLADELAQAVMQVAALAVEIEHRGGAAALGQDRGARTMSGVAELLPQLFALRDEGRRIGRRPREQDRFLDRGEAGNRRAAVV